MENFALGAIKILICTNIVESGLDIQNANTIIVQDVQQFGLAQLYQVLPIPSFISFLSVFEENYVLLKLTFQSLFGMYIFKWRSRDDTIECCKEENLLFMGFFLMPLGDGSKN